MMSSNPLTGSAALTASEDLKQFFSIYPDIVHDFTKSICVDDISNLSKYYEEMLKHIMPNMVSGSGYLVAPTYKFLESPERLTLESIRLSNILGWCQELLTLSMGVVDDIEDDSSTRHGNICWHKVDNKGLTAINDTMLVAQGSFSLLKKYFADHACYVPMIEILQETVVKTALGRRLAHSCRIVDGKNLDMCTHENYDTISKYKTNPTVDSAVRLPMYLANFHTTQTHTDVNKVLPIAAKLWQMDNDVVDCFGDPSVTGKIGSDIAAGECTWFIVEALQRMSGTQRKILEKNYGKPGPECEIAVRGLYEELQLLDLYATQKQQLYEDIHKNIEDLQSEKLRKLFRKWFSEPLKGIEVLSST